MTEYALETRGLGLRIGAAVILDDVSLTARRGELVAVIGPNGAGKTSLFNLITGVHRPTGGSVLLGGRDVTAMAVHRRGRLGLGRTFQTSSVFPALPVLENARLAAKAHLGGVLNVLKPAGSDARATAVARDCLERVGLAARADTAAGALSHGEKRKLELALVLAQDPSVILLDEPMAGMSAEDVPELTELIGSLRGTGGERTVLLIEHHMNVVLGLADRVAVMHHGTLLALDTPEKVMADATVQSAYLGEPL
ncbi:MULTISPECIES: ABC transporter ATP-binding protein [Thermomonosporaceae]|uniref:ABC transporter ATP-binding protein n=1 Tax=Thermomonosporaceae TaxID=2012 RepID=UPI00255A8E69|nr:MULTISPECIES: ABC transporter ATP-binding protein [Thermomonosporaceae]MDL4777412.1 ABC transporter ATP-binding protein [Actinomadura xylanilytica]